MLHKFIIRMDFYGNSVYDIRLIKEFNVKHDSAVFKFNENDTIDITMKFEADEWPEVILLMTDEVNYYFPGVSNLTFALQ